jgi:hypothetical protein
VASCPSPFLDDTEHGESRAGAFVGTLVCRPSLLQHLVVFAHWHSRTINSNRIYSRTTRGEPGPSSYSGNQIQLFARSPRVEVAVASFRVAVVHFNTVSRKSVASDVRWDFLADQTVTPHGCCYLIHLCTNFKWPVADYGSDLELHCRSNILHRVDYPNC